MDPPCKQLFQWETRKILGKGEFGIVRFGFLKDGRSKKPVAVKSATGSGAIDLRREKYLLDHLDGCPQIIHCYGGAAGDEEEAGKGKTYNIFLEYAPEGSLHSYLKRRPMGELSARRLVRSMLRGLAHIHRRGVAHCDIKPENIMLWGWKDVKIIDFGLAVRSSERNPAHRGTPYYTAPECVARKKYGPSGDVWALGCTLAEMLTGKPALAYLDKVDFGEFMSRIGKGQAPPEIPKRMSALGRDFLCKCFEVDAEKRWTAEMLLTHPYMAALHDDDVDHHSSWFVSKMLTRLPMIGSCVRTRRFSV